MASVAFSIKSNLTTVRFDFFMFKRYIVIKNKVCRGGETGRHAGFRTQWEKSLESSNLSRGTILIFFLGDGYALSFFVLSFWYGYG